MQAALKAFDDDHNGSLDQGEFERFAKSLMKSGGAQDSPVEGAGMLLNMALQDRIRACIAQQLSSPAQPAQGRLAGWQVAAAVTFAVPDVLQR
jgi:hypothetical protein